MSAVGFKDKLILDTANLSESDHVGAYLQDSLGNLITSQANGSQQALDVGINVAGVQIDPRQIRLLTSADVVKVSNLPTTVDTNYGTVGASTIRTAAQIGNATGAADFNGGATGAQTLRTSSNLSDGAGTALTSTLVSGKQALDVNIANSFTVGSNHAENTAHTVGDEGDFMLSYRQDTLTVDITSSGNYAGLKTNNRGALWSVPVGTVADDVADTENPVKVGSKSVAGPLSAITSANNRANLISDKYRRVYVNDSANVAAKAQAVSVTNTAATLLATASQLSGRKTYMIQNLGNKAIFIGNDATVTDASGFRISAGASLSVDLGPDVQLFAFAVSGTQDVRLLEVA